MLNHYAKPVGQRLSNLRQHFEPEAHPDCPDGKQAGARHLCRITDRMLASMLFTKAVRLLKQPEGRAPEAMPDAPSNPSALTKQNCHVPPEWLNFSSRQTQLL